MTLPDVYCRVNRARGLEVRSYLILTVKSSCASPISSF